MSMTHSRASPTDTMTYEEFLDWADEDTLAEWVDGRVVMTSPASFPHQKLKTFVAGILSKYVQVHQLGEVVDAPFQMKLPSSSGREPDAIFVTKEHLSRLKPPARPTYLDGPGDLVVEVVSVPESVKRDRVEKLKEYRQGGVPEYWILDPDRQQADFYQVDARGAYRHVAPNAQGIYRARAVRDFWLNVAWLWQDPLPDVEQVVQEITAAAHARHLVEHASDAYVRALLDQLRQQGKLPKDGR